VHEALNQSIRKQGILAHSYSLVSYPTFNLFWQLKRWFVSRGYAKSPYLRLVLSQIFTAVIAGTLD